MIYPHTTRAPDQLIAYENNARTHSDYQIAQLKRSMTEFGFTNPVLIDEKDTVIAGHGRIMAALSLDLPEVPCIVLEGLTPEQKKALVIADNQLALNAGWDDTLLKSEIIDLDDVGYDLSLLGFDTEFIDDILENDAVSDGLTGEDDVPDAPETPQTHYGDVWILGRHRLMCGDSTKESDIETLLNDKQPNAIITDPPYGLGIDGQKKSTAKNPKHNRKEHTFRDWDSERPPKSIFYTIIDMAVPTVIWGGNYFADLLPPTRGWLYWSKGQDGLTMSDGELAWTSENKPLRATTVNRGALQGSVHPTQKPVQVIDFSINFLAVPTKGLVLDLFGGSGTTLIACEKNDISCCMMELDPVYCDVIIKRWQDLTGEKAVHENGTEFE